MITKLINPFRYIAGVKSLVIGVLILLATAVIGFYSKTHFPDIISIKKCYSLPLWYFIIQSLSNWIVLSIILYLFAIIASSSSVRFIDIFGTQALARAPYFLAAFTGFFDSINKFGEYILWNTLQQGTETSITTGEIIIAITIIVISLLLTIWLVTLMYNAFKVSSNLKGAKLAVLFIVAFIGSIVGTLYITKFLITSIN